MNWRRKLRFMILYWFCKGPVCKGLQLKAHSHQHTIKITIISIHINYVTDIVVLCVVRVHV